MRILHIYKSYFPDTIGGCEYMIKTLTNYTAKKGCDNTLLTLGSARKTTITYSEQLKVIALPTHLKLSSCPFNFGLLHTFHYYANQADILHFHFPWPFADIFYLLSRTNKPAIVTYHSDIVRQKYLKYFYSPFMKKFLTRINKIIVTSQNYSDSSQDIKQYRHKTQVIPLGICKHDYELPHEDLIASWKNKIGENFLLFLGVLRAYKGLKILLQSVVGTNIPIVIAGSGPEENELKRISQTFSNITFLGKISEQDKLALLTLCKTMVLPSHLRSEAFGFCLLEAMLFGKPLISTELGTGTSFVNRHGETGLVVPPNDSQALKEAIIYLHENDEVAKKMGQASRERCLNYFSAQEMANQYVACYASL